MAWYHKLDEHQYLYQQILVKDEIQKGINYIRFLNIAKGSVNELETHLLLSKKLKLSNSKDTDPIIDLLQEETKMIISLIKKLKS